MPRAARIKSPMDIYHKMSRSITEFDLFQDSNEAFPQYLNSTNLNSMQINFVKRIVSYVVRNGMMKDLSVLAEAPFNEMGSVAEVFDDIGIWIDIRKVLMVLIRMPRWHNFVIIEDETKLPFQPYVW